MSHPVTAAFALLVAGLPAALALIWGRGLRRFEDDPALPERLIANRTRNGFAFSVAVGLLVVGASDHLVWALPLLIATRLIAGFPLRKALLGETWRLPAYLWFFARLAFAAYGFWILLAALPQLEALAGSRDWIVGVVLGCAAVGWSLAYSIVFRRILGAAPLAAAEILEPFERMRAVIGRTVTVEQVAVRGGEFVNAVAFPSTGRSSVVVTDRLVARMTTAEVVAVLAHELAHVEHFTAKRLRAKFLVTGILIGLAMLVTPILHRVDPSSVWSAAGIWPLVLFGVMAIQLRQRQSHETASDLRAIELCGDPDALISALIKLHAAARLPRRWNPEFERRATHPSLARRIQAIRSAAGTVAATTRGVTPFSVADEAASVCFQNEALVWTDASSITHTIPYRQLTTVRVDVRATGAARLVAVDTAHRRWEIALANHDVGRVQSALDLVDSQFAPAAAHGISPSLSRTVAALVTLFTLTTSQYAATFVACLAALSPVAPLVAAAGVAAAAGTVVTWRDHLVRSTPDIWTAATVFACGTALIAFGYMNRKETISSSARKALGALAVGAALAFAAAAPSVSPLDVLTVHWVTRQWPALVLLPLALATAFLFIRSRVGRYVSALLAVVAGINLLAGSTFFVDRFSTDPLLIRGGLVSVRTVESKPLKEAAVSFNVMQLWVSPIGARVALASEDDDEHVTIHAGTVGGALTTLDADQASFLDDHRVFLLKRDGNAALLRVVDLDAGARELWSRRLGIFAFEVLVDRASGRWRLFGLRDYQAIVSVEGRIGDERVTEMQVPFPPGRPTLRPLAAAGRSIAAIETRFPPPDVSRNTFRQMVALMTGRRPRSDTTLWTIDASGNRAFAQSRLDVACRAASIDDAGASCAAFDGSRTGLFALDAATQRPIPLASIVGHLYLEDVDSDGWMAGRWNGGPIAFRPSTREAIRVAPERDGTPYQLAYSGNILVTVTIAEEGSILRAYQTR